MQSGVLFRGVLHVDKYHHAEAVVRVTAADAPDDDDSNPAGGALLVLGDIHRNRAVHGDTVVVQLLPKAQWTRPSSRLNVGSTIGVTQTIDVLVAMCFNVFDGSRCSWCIGTRRGGTPRRLRCPAVEPAPTRQRRWGISCAYPAVLSSAMFRMDPVLVVHRT